MKAFIYNNESNKKVIENSVMALGSFYSMHIGHQEIFKKTIEVAKDKQISSGVLLFNEMDKFPQKEVYPLSWRVNYLMELGFDFVVIFDKNQLNMNTEGDDFITNLEDNYGASEFVVGKDFRYGKMAKWDAQYLGKNKITNIIDLVKIDNKKVSTSFIHEVIELGDLTLLETLLGRKYSNGGQVIHGESTAHELGMPTANIEINKNITLIPDGVYLAYTKLNKLIYPSLVSVGKKPTFHDNFEITTESHILNFNKDIYGENIEIIYIKKIRNQIKFDNIKKLIHQLRLDKDYAISWFVDNKL